MNKALLIACAVVLPVTLNHSANASLVTLHDIDDTYVAGSTILGSNDQNHGSEATLKAFRNGSFWAESLIRVNDIFGVGPFQVPPNATVSSASLHLWLDVSWGRDPNPYSLYQLTTDWNEATVTSNSFGRVLDQSNGVAIDTLAGPTVNPFNTNTEFVFDVTSSVVAWQNGTSNHGWGLTAAAARNDFFSSETSDSTWRPYLRVNFVVVPEPGFPVAVGLASVGFWILRRCRHGYFA